MEAVSSTPVLPKTDGGLVGAKIGSMAVLGGCALVASLLPVLLARRCSTNKNFLDYLLRFGGGILLATTFIHLLPEVREGLEDVNEPWVKDLPVQLPELLMCVGFFIMYGIEEVAHKLLGHSHHHHQDTEKTSLHTDQHVQNSGLSLEEIKREFLRLPEDSVLSSFGESDDELFTKESTAIWSRWRKKDDELRLVYKEVEEKKRSEKSWKSGTPLRAILITLAISIHQVFEGLAVGLEVHTEQVWILTGAIAAHKVVIAVCIGAEAAQSPPCSIAILLASFSIATPLGTAIGLILSTDSSLGIVPTLLQGLASGTLLFVVFFEVLQRSHDGPKIGQFLVTALGFLLMLILLCIFQS